MIDESLLEAMDGVVFVTNPDGLVTAIGTRNWNTFAATNGAPELEAESIIGCELLDFVSGEEVRRHLLRQMRRGPADQESKDPVLLRCDSPECMRIMRQSIRPLYSGDRYLGLVFQSVELHSVKRPPIGLFDFKEIERQASAEPQRPIVTMCSWCQKVRHEPVTAERWVEAEAYYAAGGHSRVQISHGICDPCTERIETEWDGP